MIQGICRDQFLHSLLSTRGVGILSNQVRNQKALRNSFIGFFICIHRYVDMYTYLYLGLRFVTEFIFVFGSVFRVFRVQAFEFLV